MLRDDNPQQDDTQACPYRTISINGFSFHYYSFPPVDRPELPAMERILSSIIMTIVLSMSIINLQHISPNRITRRIKISARKSTTSLRILSRNNFSTLTFRHLTFEHWNWTWMSFFISPKPRILHMWCLRSFHPLPISFRLVFSSNVQT